MTHNPRVPLVKMLVAALAVLGLAAWLLSGGERTGLVTGRQNAAPDTELARLESLGYLSGYRAPPEDDPALGQSREQMAPGLTLYTSGHAAAAYLIDASGSPLHSWSVPFEQAFPEQRVPARHRRRDLASYWRHATLLKDGSLLAIYEGLGLIKLDRQSHVQWARFNRAHHDLEVAPDGSMVVLTRQVERRSGAPVMVDYISYLSADGVEKSRISVLDAILNSPFSQEILGPKRIAGDALHTNSLQTLRPPLSGFPAGVENGDILLSLRNRHALVIVSPRTQKAVWAFRGDFKKQHFARLLPEGRLVLFDNLSRRNYSRSLIYSWPDLRLIENIDSWAAGRRFLSRSLGLAQPLSNGNLLIVESEGGRMVELDRARKVVWSFTNPHRTGPNNRLIAVISHAQREAGAEPPHF